MSIDFDNIQEVTLQQQLKATKYMIAQITLGGQAVTSGGKAVTFANLPELRKMQAELEAQIARESGQSGIGQFGFNR